MAASIFYIGSLPMNSLLIADRLLVASIPEGADKPYKYPGTYRGVQTLVINKIDLLPYVPFDMDYFQRGVEILNPPLTTFKVSFRTGEGIPARCDDS